MLAALSDQFADVFLDSRNIPCASFRDLSETGGIDVQALDFDQDLVFSQRQGGIDTRGLLGKRARWLEHPLDSQGIRRTELDGRRHPLFRFGACHAFFGDLVGNEIGRLFFGF